MPSLPPAYDNAANPDAPDCSKWDNRENVCWLATIVTMNSDGTYKCEHMDNPQWWEFFSDAYYYRYDIDYITCLITLGAMAVAIIFSAIKICRILWELAIYRVLAMFFSLADLHNGEKMKEIIKAFAAPEAAFPATYIAPTVDAAERMPASTPISFWHRFGPSITAIATETSITDFEKPSMFCVVSHAENIM